MNPGAAQMQTWELMAKYGLVERGWNFAWTRRKTQLGCCDHTHHTIKLSRPYVQLNPESIVRDTILHEIAHALVGYQAGHGLVWKLKAQELGARPEACKDPQLFPGFVSVPGKYQATCGVCGYVFNRDRLPKANRIIRCGICYAVDRERSKLNYQLVARKEI